MRLKKFVVVALAAMMTLPMAVPAAAATSPSRHHSGGGGGGGGGGGAPVGSGSVGTTSAAGAIGNVLYGWQYDQNTGKWWYKYNDQTWAVGWANLYWKPAADKDGYYAWYHFDNDGWMDTGFYHDTDGKDYYLHPVSDGTKGRMITGDVKIDGVTYSFETEAGNYQGHLKNILK